jgi:hypothetical protein
LILNTMVYLSANGEVIGKFDVMDLSAALASGKIPRDAFFWREGMPEWQPLADLPLPPPPPRRPLAPAPIAATPRRSLAAFSMPRAEPKLQLDPEVAGAGRARQPFVPRAVPSAAAKSEKSPAPEEAANTAPSAPASAKQATTLLRETPAPAAVGVSPPKLQLDPEVTGAGRARQPFIPRAVPSSSVKSEKSPAPVEAANTAPSAPAPAKQATTLLRETPAAAAVGGVGPAKPAPAEKSPAMAISTDQEKAEKPRAARPAAADRARVPVDAESEADPGTAGAPIAAPLPPPRRRRGILAAALFLLLAAAAGGAAWWFLFTGSPALTGEVRLPAADGGLVPAPGAAVFVVPREELAARWRTQLEEAQSRAAELDEVLAQARTAHREKSLVLEQAARVSEVADEYNMPDAAELRAERDSAQVEEQAARAEVEKITREQESLVGLGAFLTAPPEAIAQAATDDNGFFRLPLPEVNEGLVLLVVSGRPADGGPEVWGWFTPLDPERGRSEPWRFGPEDALDADRLRQIVAAASGPAPGTAPLP